MRLAHLALVALLAALALAACTGGEPPPPTPEATPTPTPTATPEATPTPHAHATPEATPTPTPTATPEATPTPHAHATPEATPTPAPTPTPPATPTPDARSGLELIEPAPGAFVHRTFEDGEDIDWEHGVFVLDAETGRTEGYAVAGVKGDAELYYPYWYTQWHASWIPARDHEYRAEWGLLLDRETGDSWRWPYRALRLVASSEHVLVFEDLDADADWRSTGRFTGRFTLANRGMEEIARFSVAAGDRHDDALFSPDGSNLVLKRPNKVYLVPVATGVPALLFEEANEYISIGQMDDGSGIVVKAGWPTRYYFGWDGAEAAVPAPRPACFGEFPGKLSPDGRYTAELVGRPYRVYPNDIDPLDHPWPSVVIADAETCAPIFRVRSAYTNQFAWSAEWLSTSEGFVIGVLGGRVIARVLPEPALEPLPEGEPWRRAVPAPTGGGRYFGYGPRVYDAAEDRWRGPGQARGWLFWWGDSHRERWFQYPVYTGAGRTSWALLPHKIEFPPFAEETAFRVARTGSCLRLREEPDKESRVLDCLPDGERLLFVESDAEPEWGQPHPSFQFTRGTWVRVRTADGAEGWVSHGYLEHD